MNKNIGIILTSLAFSMVVSGCGNHKQATATKSSATLVSKQVASSQATSKVAANSEAKVESATTKAAATSSSVVRQQPAPKQQPVQKKQPVAQQPAQKQQPDQTASQASSKTASSEVFYGHQALTDFINKYGMTPAVYKMEHGMSERQALESTPDNMKTSGEIQTGYLEYGIK